jgi:hypothetical protein
MYLDEESFRRTLVSKMRQLSPGEEAPFDFWPYVAEIPDADYGGFDCSEGRIRWVWRGEDGVFEHVLIDSEESKDVFMVIVLDRMKKEVVGHRLLDLKQEYDLRGEG